MLKEELKFKYGFEMQETKFSRVSALANETVSSSRVGRKKKKLASKNLNVLILTLIYIFMMSIIGRFMITLIVNLIFDFEK